MAAAGRKVKRFVIDVNTFITIFINNETEWLLRYIARNKIEIFIDRNLVNELSRVLEYPKIKKILPLDSTLYLNVVRLISTEITAKSYQVHSPDPEDDYLFDLALTSNSKVLVTGEKALLSWANSPVQIISFTVFRKMF